MEGEHQVTGRGHHPHTAHQVFDGYLATGGVGVTILTLIVAPQTPVGRSGIKITSPKDSEEVGWAFPVAGSYEAIPKGFDLWVITTDVSSERYWPQERATIDKDKKAWSGQVTGIGGKPGETRTFGVFLVGEDGQRLLELWRRAAGIQKNLRQLDPAGEHKSLDLTDLTNDFEKADEVKVTVESGKP